MSATACVLAMASVVLLLQATPLHQQQLRHLDETPHPTPPRSHSLLLRACCSVSRRASESSPGAGVKTLK